MAEETLNSQFKVERKYYLGYTDVVPGTNKKVAAVRKEYLAGVAAEDARMAKRQKDWLDKRKDAEKPTVQTTAVTAGVVRDINLDAAAPTPLGIVAPDETPKPLTKDELMKLGKDDLVAEAYKAGINTVPDSMTKEQIADLILAK